MAEKSKITLIYDLDKTLCTKKERGQTYADVKPIQPIIDQLNHYYDEGFEIIINTARNMVTQNNHISKVIQNVGLDTLEWLKKHDVKYHGLQFGKEYGHLYIDDKSCLNDTDEIERRVQAIYDGTEEEYLVEYMNLRRNSEVLENHNKLLRNEVESLKKKVDQLEQDKMWMVDEDKLHK